MHFIIFYYVLVLVRRTTPCDASSHIPVFVFVFVFVLDLHLLFGYSTAHQLHCSIDFMQLALYDIWGTYLFTRQVPVIMQRSPPE